MFLGLSPRNSITSSVPYTDLKIQAPFTPTRRIVQTAKWEVNDPLVHYLPDDLRLFKDGVLTNEVKTRTLAGPTAVKMTDDTSLMRMNDRFRPWGGNPNGLAENDTTASDLRVKDPGIRNSDDWDFPTQKYPNVGWLGRVHRGTPWQTMYLKAYPIAPDAPDNWMIPLGGPGLAMDNHPTNDWKFLDLFTTAIHPNATRGQLSVNQTNLAAWSAVLSGAAVTKLVLANATDPPVRTDDFVPPAALDPAVQQIFDGLSVERQRRGRFDHIGDILAVPELSVNSPFLKPPYTDPRITNPADSLKDIDYERIPDQIMSLLKVGDARFVIYAFGQSLKPEYVDPKTGVALNYQITGEVATRSVVRVDFEKVTDPVDPRFGGPDVNRPHVVVEQFNVLPPE
jgi:hypothetical protein